MRKFALVIFALVSLQSHAQFGKDPLINLENFDKQRVYWGYFLGFNAYDFKIDLKTPQQQDILVKTTTGFNVGLVGVLRLQEYVELRFEPGLYYTQRDLQYPGFSNQLDATRQVKSTYIHFPVLLKFMSKRIGNIRPYLEGGVSSTLNLSSNAKSDDDNLEQRFRVKAWTYNYELGFGVDLYFEYFKFSPSIRGVFGFSDELIRDNDPNSPWTGNIESLKTRAVLINFTFH
ncbi:MAG: PorT family protein [Flavobacterium sp.]|nr:MAG: PorT family protein [Flavobacterium sp.]